MTVSALPKGRYWCCICLAFALCGCSANVAHNLEESDANRIVVALTRQGLSAQKASDAQHEGRWVVEVPRERSAEALELLASAQLPPQKTTGLLEALGEGGLVPSPVAEQARLLAGTAGELERSLRAVEGVVTARVHLAAAPVSPLALPEERGQPSASVLLTYRGASSPLGPLDIQRLVAGALPGLKPEQVTVVAAPVPALREAVSRDWAQLGPLTVAKKSRSQLRALVGGIVVTNLALLGVLLWVWLRARRAEAALGAATAVPVVPAPSAGLRRAR